MGHHHEIQVQVQPVDKEKIKKIWTVAGIMALITILEFVVAFTLPHEYKWLRISIFVGMTIVKAFYIVAEFMHLRHEVKTLIWSIIIPLVFVVWLIIALLYEGGSVMDLRY
ncbi:cytochrome C oxidase subunit IV family protein [Cytophagales bacterium LB-30]|uniref:Cytochrome C oxidase subunit IV family protein n=1 Tax=Shiella aurantiaca TaxID=3058365 RepID=A0ABT8F470_9BACT|nr:cytochrome C oxidase subunit IV family protein [Shiella aurantiaca]MDN4165169.1 cytochrome C oxidase subunit IV family protein [Shiella aurantiaca]